MSVKTKLLYFIYLSIKSLDFSLMDQFRTSILKRLLKVYINNLLVRSGVIIHHFENLTLGNDVSINHGCFLSCIGGLKIGNFVSIGHNTSIITSEHSYSDPKVPIKYQPIIEKPVMIGNNVWIGANVTILAGVSIASNTIIAAGAIVTKSVLKEKTIIGGCPAKFIKNLSNE